MEFEDALKALKDGNKVTNENWNGKGMYLEMQVPSELSKMERPYLYINPGEGWMVPWNPSQMDMFLDTWNVVGDDE